MDAKTETDNNEKTMYSDLFFTVSRHELITAVAYRLLSATAKAKVDELLPPDDLDLAFTESGGWADQIKDNQPPTDEETKNFLANLDNKNHRTWHYVNLPLGVSSYSEAANLGFTRTDDVVQTINKCISVLQRESTRFSRVNALRLLGHLTGDVHQPLHVGCGFIDESGDIPTVITDPEEIIAKNLKNHTDTGGNKILLPGAGNLHSFWDGKVGGNVNETDITPLASEDKNETDAEHKEYWVNKLFEMAKSDNLTDNSEGLAEIHNLFDLAESWATESLKISVEAYRTLKITDKTNRGYQVSWEGKNQYRLRCDPLLLEQMKLAVRHLADLLNEIYK